MHIKYDYYYYFNFFITLIFNYTNAEKVYNCIKMLYAKIILYNRNKCIKSKSIPDGIYLRERPYFTA